MNNNLAVIPRNGHSKTSTLTVEIDPEKPSNEIPLTRDAFLMYLKEVGEVALLTPKEEIALANRIKCGDKVARSHMIRANLRLVVKIARDYEGYGLPLLDLISEGNVGLMKGVDRFDPTNGAKFSTYGSWWIKQSIKRALSNQSRTIRLPVHVTDAVSKIKKMDREALRERGEILTDEEMAKKLGVSVKRIKFLRTVDKPPLPLDALVSEDGANTWGDITADEDAVDPALDLVRKSEWARVRQFASQLSEREQVIISMRFGLDGNDEKPLSKVGKKFGVSPERIRQVEEIALRKLRAKLEGLAYRPKRRKRSN